MPDNDPWKDLFEKAGKLSHKTNTKVSKWAAEYNKRNTTEQNKLTGMGDVLVADEQDNSSFVSAQDQGTNGENTTDGQAVQDRTIRKPVYKPSIADLRYLDTQQP